MPSGREKWIIISVSFVNSKPVHSHKYLIAWERKDKLAIQFLFQDAQGTHKKTRKEKGKKKGKREKEEGKR